jgi:hypothetical protein
MLSTQDFTERLAEMADMCDQALDLIEEAHDLSCCRKEASDPLVRSITRINRCHRYMSYGGQISGLLLSPVPPIRPARG